MTPAVLGRSNQASPRTASGSTALFNQSDYWRMVILRLMPLIVALALTGCINCRHDYRGESQLWGGYDPGQIYILKRDVFVMSVDGELAGSRLALVPENELRWPSQRGRYYSAPTSIAAYRRDPVAASTYSNFAVGQAFHRTNSLCVLENVAGIAETGVRISPTRIERNRGLNLWSGHHDDLTPFAEILDGPFAGREVDVSDLSDRYQINDSGLFLYRPVAIILEVAP